MVEGLSHITFIVQDLERTADFLKAIFDAVEVYDSADKPHSLSRERFFLIGNVWIATMEGEPLSEQTYNHVAFRIPDDKFEEYQQRIRDLGPEVRVSRPRIEGEGRSLYFHDYDNHLFELHTGTLSQRLMAYRDADMG
ncbi:FosX/FosE/FosI family fosfomycin resistance hydrolase [Pseudodesulfovibrio sp. zrk46]|uniref:FosX/FosE/FosI family fosfomycin resistance hydrolase n=1 Tax=Pseudodesulfovibrio sp. zrk46 TaxID=2725288 RepID=UPI0014498A00|nr:FosX/FosE/FosI family fosfomycin resistance hydrolase [Pseudodesulfovibrio sp. zrk46]QJB56314.1 FosX/FosE/FosI family fosfomycin resistance thiol transferase [Pseudodesulfovibrio sp. zrk46]